MTLATLLSASAHPTSLCTLPPHERAGSSNARIEAGRRRREAALFERSAGWAGSAAD